MEEETIKTIMYFTFALLAVFILIGVLYFYAQSTGLYEVLIG